jgi:hypothetical protein
MPNPYLSGRIPVELDKQVDDFLARTGETKTQMLIKAVSAYIGVEAPPLKVTSDWRMENVEQKVAELEGAVKSLYEKIAALTAKIENPKVQLEPIIAYENSSDNNDNNADNNDHIENIDKIDYNSSDTDNAVDSSDNYVENQKANTPDNNLDNNDNIPETIQTIDVKPTSNNKKTFIEVDTAKAAKLTRLDPKKFTDLRGAFNRKLKKDNQILPEKTILERPIKMTPPSGVRIEKIPYDIFYVGQSQEGRNLWNLVPENTPGEQIPLTFPTDNA